MENKLVSQNDLKQIESKQILIGKTLNCSFILQASSITKIPKMFLLHFLIRFIEIINKFITIIIN